VAAALFMMLIAIPRFLRLAATQKAIDSLKALLNAGQH
jgi:hypothetical protein